MKPVPPVKVVYEKECPPPGIGQLKFLGIFLLVMGAFVLGVLCQWPNSEEIRDRQLAKMNAEPGDIIAVVIQSDPIQTGSMMIQKASCKQENGTYNEIWVRTDTPYEVGTPVNVQMVTLSREGQSTTDTEYFATNEQL